MFNLLVGIAIGIGLMLVPKIYTAIKNKADSIK